jgi:hypothetical protein
MPEEFQGQHDDLSTDLNSSTNREMDRIALELFLLSNNIKGPAGQTEEGTGANNERVIQMLKDYGWRNLKHF